MAPPLSSDEEEIASKYRKLLKMGMPEGAVMQKMSTDGVDQRIVDAVVSGEHKEESKMEVAKLQTPPPSPRHTKQQIGPLSPQQKVVASKYQKMLQMGMPEGAVIQKMTNDCVDQKIFDAVLEGGHEEVETKTEIKQPTPPLSPKKSDNMETTDDNDKQQTESLLSPEDEEIANKYRKMSKMGMPEGAVMQKMATDGVAEHIVNAVWKYIVNAAFEDVEEEELKSSSQSNETNESSEELVDDASARSLKSEEQSAEYEYITDDSDMDTASDFEETIVTESDTANAAAIQQKQQQQQQQPETSADTLSSRSRTDVDKDVVITVEEETLDEDGTVEEEITVDEEMTIEEEMTVEEEITVDDSDEHSLGLDQLGREPPNQMTESDISDMPSDEGAERTALKSAKRQSEEEEMMNIAMETDVILRGQSGSLDHSDESIEEEEINFEMDESLSDSDVENQLRNASLTQATQQQRTAQQQSSSQRRRRKHPDSKFHVFVFFCYVLLIGGGVAVLLYFLLFDDNSKDPPQSNDQYATFFDPIQSPTNCNLSNLEQPHVIDQCNCFGTVSVISDSIRERYNIHRTSFIPSIYETYEESIESCTVRNQALLWLSSGNDIDFGPNEREQRFALANFFIGTKGEEWTNRSNWLSSERSCSWFGVSCNVESAVESLLMDTNNVAGSLPGEVILLASLQNFSLPQNNLEGSIPQDIFLIPSLEELYLDDNKWSGAIPLSMYQAVKLRRLSLGNNALTGTMIGNISDLVALEELGLGGNMLSGELPPSLFDLPELTDLQLHENIFSGTIPPRISNAKNLTTLTLGPNRFSGTFPSEIAQLNKLERLSCRGVPFTGTIPSTLSNLLALQVLIISETEMSGFIPFSISSMSTLEVLDLSGNKLTDIIPTRFGNLLQLDALNLSGNFLSGSLPTELGNLNLVTQIRLNDNRFTSTIPNELGKLGTLEEMFLDGNALEGGVPSQICDLRTASLSQLVVDCDDGITGVSCTIPSCCTSCRQ